MWGQKKSRVCNYKEVKKANRIGKWEYKDLSQRKKRMDVKKIMKALDDRYSHGKVRKGEKKIKDIDI